MGKQENDTKLDKDRLRRLEQLGSSWNDPTHEWDQKKLTPADIRLLFEHFEPLQDLICVIANRSTSDEVVSLSVEADRRTDNSNMFHSQSELAAAQELCGALKRDLAKCEASIGQLQQINCELEEQLQIAQKDLSACRAELARSVSTPAELNLLRSNVELALRLGLADLPVDDSKALVRAVAVLSQMNNIERLWDALKAACDRQSRPASANESALLQSALDWHNHNWQAKPFALLHPGNGKHFDFSKEQRAISTPSGDSVSAVWLPGIVSGNGTVQKKALVATR